jgi:hypothetical protein
MTHRRKLAQDVGAHVPSARGGPANTHPDAAKQWIAQGAEDGPHAIVPTEMWKWNEGMGGGGRRAEVAGFGLRTHGPAAPVQPPSHSHPSHLLRTALMLDRNGA